jgi:hypothetical protein
MAMKIHIVVSCVKTPCVPVGKYNIFEKYTVPIRQSSMFLETLAHFYQAVCSYDPKYHNNNALKILNKPTILQDCIINLGVVYTNKYSSKKKPISSRRLTVTVTLIY